MANSKDVYLIEKDPIYTTITHPQYIKRDLAFEYAWYFEGPYGQKIRNTSKKTLVDNGEFYTGFRSRVENILRTKNIPFTTIYQDYGNYAVTKPSLKGVVELREHQLQAIEVMHSKTRGIWQAPTASGKTITFAAFISTILVPTIIVVHTKSLFTQTYSRMCSYFGKGKVGRIGSGYNEGGKLITVAMIHTISDMKRKWKADVVIVDECHHVSSFGGMYAAFLRRCPAPYRFGFTATLPKREEASMAMEGLLGPLLGKIEYQDLIEKKQLAKPRLQLFKVPDQRVYYRGKYAEVYDQGIVNNKIRNQLIVKKAVQWLKKGLTVLILVERIDHGKILLAYFNALLPGRFVFLSGEDDKEKISSEQEKFDTRERKGVIATRVWAEGVDIPSVGVVINAVGGKSEIATIQRFGRGMRVTKEKKDVVLIDFMDCNHSFFQRHSMERISLYFELGWIGGEE